MSKIQEALQKAANEKQSQIPDIERTKITAAYSPQPIRPGQFDPHLVVHLDPDDVISDQFRTLRTLLHIGERGKMLQKILVSSPSQKEGKTTICLNLAIAMATEPGKKVLVIDSDLRNPTVHKMLGVKLSPGLYDLLTDSVSLEQTLQQCGLPNLFIITAGKRLTNPTDILSSPTIKELLNQVTSQFDYILFDAPPVVPVPDTTALALNSDGVLLVVEAEKTRLPTLSSALELLEKANINVVGLILNKLRGVSSEYRYRYGKD